MEFLVGISGTEKSKLASICPLLPCVPLTVYRFLVQEKVQRSKLQSSPEAVTQGWTIAPSFGSLHEQLFVVLGSCSLLSSTIDLLCLRPHLLRISCIFIVDNRRSIEPFLAPRPSERWDSIPIRDRSWVRPRTKDWDVWLAMSSSSCQTIHVGRVHPVAFQGSCSPCPAIFGLKSRQPYCPLHPQS